MEDKDRQFQQVREDVAVIKERICANTSAQKEVLEDLKFQISRLQKQNEDQTNEMRDTLHKLTVKIERMEAQNKTLQWIVGVLIACLSVVVVWVKGVM